MQAVNLRLSNKHQLSVATKTYSFRMEKQQAKHAGFKIYDSKDYFKEKSDVPIVLEEQEIAAATVENEDIEYLVDKYYKTYYIP